MPGWELVGYAEKAMVDSIFDDNHGVNFAHGFAGLRKKYYVRDLEKKVCQITGAKYCQAVSSGSAGLYVALKALGIGRGDEVITSAFTFIATIEAILMTGAIPIPVNIDNSFNLDPDEVRKKIGPNTAAILPVHMAGASANMDALMALSKEFNLPILEDACQALGAKYRGKFCGTIGKVGVYSLDAGKIIQSGEGGLIVTDDKEVYEKCRMFHDHGHDYSLADRAKEIPQCTGFNFRMTEISAAYAIAQLDKLEFVLEGQQTRKHRMGNLLTESRTILDPNESGDCFIFTFSSIEKANAIVYDMKQVGIGTKNIPDSLNWHFAGNWNHIFNDADLVEWNKTKDLLYRSIAVPITFSQDTDKVAFLLADIFKKHAD